MMEKSFLEQKEKFLKEILNELHAKLKDWSYGKFESGDEVDISSQEDEYSNVLKFRKRTTNYMLKVQNSLTMVQEGTYGECQDCGEGITQTRLDARPTATLCISCKEEEEQIQNKSAKVLPFKPTVKMDLDKVSGEAPDFH